MRRALTWILAALVMAATVIGLTASTASADHLWL
jgi:hypothetical protein